MLKAAWKRRAETRQRSFNPDADILFNYPFRNVDKEPQLLELSSGFSCKSDDIGDEDRSESRTMERASLTALQQALITEGVQRFHCAVKDRGIPIIHAVIHHAPAWYVAATEQAIRRADDCGNAIVIKGAIKLAGHDSDAYKGPEFNTTTAGHFTVPLNQFYGEQFYRWLGEALDAR